MGVIKDKGLKDEVAALTKYSKIVRSANTLIAVFLDHSSSYDRTKDAMAIGACIQNMLLTIHSLGLGAVWLGEILEKKEEVLELVGGQGDICIADMISQDILPQRRMV